MGAPQPLAGIVYNALTTFMCGVWPANTRRRPGLHMATTCASFVGQTRARVLKVSVPVYFGSFPFYL